MGYPHNDLTALKEILKRSKKFEKRLMVTDAYFSMDGDIAPLPELISLCREFDARLMIDEAHSMGVYGKTGAGLTEHFGVQSQVDIVMGTLSKALGSVGGYIAGSLLLKDFLINQSRAFIYTTAPSPMASAAALESLSVIQKNPSLRSSLWSNVRFMREGLESLGFNLMGSEGPIVPILIGDSAKAVQAKLFLEKEGFFVSSIRPPTVSAKTDRLRVSLMSTHKKEELEAFLKALKKLKEKLSL